MHTCHNDKLFSINIAGGWWLDADAVCLDPIHATLNDQVFRDEILSAFSRAQGHPPTAADNHTEEALPSFHQACIFAWENSVQLGTSANPLNWAFACTANHPLLLSALHLSAERIVQWNASAPLLISDPQFTARVEVGVEEERSVGAIEAGCWVLVLVVML